MESKCDVGTESMVNRKRETQKKPGQNLARGFKKKIDTVLLVIHARGKITLVTQ